MVEKKKALCSYCGNDFVIKKYLIRHVNREQPQKIHCFCNKKCRTKWIQRIQRNTERAEKKALKKKSKDKIIAESEKLKKKRIADESERLTQKQIIYDKLRSGIRGNW